MLSLPPRASEMTAKFEVRGNMIRAAARVASVVPVDDADVRISYGKTRSREDPVPISPGPSGCAHVSREERNQRLQAAVTAKQLLPRLRAEDSGSPRDDARRP
jgi:hypothetical protein